MSAKQQGASELINRLTKICSRSLVNRTLETALAHMPYSDYGTACDARRVRDVFALAST